MAEDRPLALLLAGPNGAGKTTIARRLVPSLLPTPHFVNADEIARGLSPLAPELAAVAAGKLAIARRRELADQGLDFAIESTIASSRNPATFLRTLQGRGYLVRLVFVWLRTPDLAIGRVACRASEGGHGVPAEAVRRRYARGLTNLREVYLPMADEWFLLDNSGEATRAVARGGRRLALEVMDERCYREISEGGAS